jgi:hypothetical protein
MILTRYLYQKDHVEYSIACSLSSNNKEEAKFWAYELYYSGFKDETLKILVEYYEKQYSTNPKFSKIKRYIMNKYEEWKTDNTQDFIVGTIIENIVKIVSKSNATTNSNQKILWIKLSETDILKYKSSPFIATKAWKMPRRLCIYKCHEDPSIPFKSTIDDYCNWLYYAYSSPFWSNKIKKYGGIVNDKEKTVIFDDDDKEEQFHNLYNMEPDEQPMQTLLNWGVIL